MSAFAPPLGPVAMDMRTLIDVRPAPDSAVLGPDSFEDNVDATHPYTRNVEIPTETVGVLAVTLRMRTKAYRYYVSSVISPNVPGQGIHQHTQTDIAAPMTDTDATAGGTGATGGPSSTTVVDVLATKTTSDHAHTPAAMGNQDTLHQHVESGGGTTGNENANHKHSQSATGGSSQGSYVNDVTFTNVDVADDVHSHTGPSHGHSHDHAVSHQHSLTGQPADGAHLHTLTVTGAIVETDTPTQVSVSVDGAVASATALELDDFDLIPYLTKDSQGMVARGLHTVAFTPNDVGRIQATLTGIVLLQARGR